MLYKTLMWETLKQTVSILKFRDKVAGFGHCFQVRLVAGIVVTRYYFKNS